MYLASKRGCRTYDDLPNLLALEFRVSGRPYLLLSAVGFPYVLNVTEWPASWRGIAGDFRSCLRDDKNPASIV